MTSIGPGSLGAINLAGSLAGSQRNAGETDRIKQGGSERQMSADLKAIAARTMEDIGETDQSADRDADGRLPFGAGNEQADDESPQQSNPGGSESNRRRPRDADGERGRLLDLEA